MQGVCAEAPPAAASVTIPAAFAAGLVLHRDPGGALWVVARGPGAPPLAAAEVGARLDPARLPRELAAALAELDETAPAAGGKAGAAWCRRLGAGAEALELRALPAPSGGWLLQLLDRGEVVRLERALARAREELQQFAYAASHDLREPLRTVASFCELLRRRYRGRLDEDADTFIDFAVDGARRMQALLEALLEFSRVETRGGPLVPVELGPLVARVAEAFAPRFAELGGSLQIGPLPVVRGDARQLARLFRELLDNALRYRGEAPPRVRIDGEVRDGVACIRVQDHGIGIPPEFHERVFRIFQRLHSRDEIPGTGAGLAICRRIVERHGGRMGLESEPGRGATFLVELPLAESASGVPATA